MHPQRPTYEIPDEAKQQLGLQQSLLNAEMPGEEQAKQNIYGSQANAMSGLFRAAGDQGQLLSGLSAVQGGTNNALNGLQTQRAQNYYTNLSGLARAQNLMAQYRDRAFETNEMDPYMMDLQRKYDLQNSGNQEILSGINGLASTASALMGQSDGAQSVGGTTGTTGTSLPMLSSGPVGGIGSISPLSGLGSATLAPMGAAAGGAGAASGLMGLISSGAVFI